MPPQAHLFLRAPFWDSSLNQESNEDRAGYIPKREMTRPQTGDFDLFTLWAFTQCNFLWIPHGGLSKDDPCASCIVKKTDLTKEGPLS